MRVFVTVGTTSFDDLIEKLNQDEIIKNLVESHYTELVIQYGRGLFVPENRNTNDIKVKCFRYKDSILEDIKAADLVISHAGAGSCLEVLGHGKKLIVVVNEKLMDNHQFELAEQLYKDGHLLYCTPSNLKDTILQMKTVELKPFVKGNSNKFAKFLNGYFGLTE